MIFWVGALMATVGMIVGWIGFRGMSQLRKRKPLHNYTGGSSHFTIQDIGDYTVTIEGSNFGKLHLENVKLRDASSGESVPLQLTEKHKVKFQNKFYHEALDFKVEKKSSFELEITNYEELITHLSKYKIVEKWTKHRRPEIKVFRTYSDQFRIKHLVLFGVGWFDGLFGIAIMYLNK